MDGVSLEGLLDNGILRKLGGKFQLRIHLGIYHLPFNDLLFHAQTIHRANFDPNSVQLSRLLSIKTGGCPEDCGYCSQSAHYPTGLKASKLMEVERVIEEARKAKIQGSVMIRAEIDARGQVQSLSIAQGLGLGLDERAVEAVRKWRFRPGTEDGHNVKTDVNVEITFGIN